MTGKGRFEPFDRDQQAVADWVETGPSPTRVRATGLRRKRSLRRSWCAPSGFPEADVRDPVTNKQASFAADRYR
jgi:hypothetical protein